MALRAMISAFGVLLLALPSSVATSREMVLWHSYREAEQVALEGLLARWNREHRDTPVRALAVPYDAYANKLTSAIPRGQGPDLFIFAHERIGDWSRSKLLRPLDGELEPAELSRFAPVTVEALRYGGHLWGVPLAFKSVALFYNTKLVASPPRTTDELLSSMRKLSSAKDGRFGLAYEAGAFYYHAAWLFGFGGRIFDDAGRARLDTPENRRSYEFAVQITREGLVPKEPTSALVAQLFNEGRAAMVINGPWFTGEIKSGVPYAVAPLPKVSETGLDATPFLTVDAVIFSAQSAQTKDALELAKFLALGDGARYRLERGGQLVADSRAYTDVSNGRGKPLSPVLEQFRKQAERATPMPNNPLMRSVWEPAARGLRAVLRGSDTAETALRRADRELSIVTRDPPPPSSPEPYLTGFIVIGAALVGLVFWRNRTRRLWHEIRAARHAYLCLLPSFLAILVLVFIPFAVGTVVAFYTHKGGEFTFVGLANFVDIVTSRDYPIAEPLSFYYTLVVTVLWTTINVFLHVSIGLFLAMMLRKPWLRLRGVYRVLLIVPWAVPNYITALIWKGMFHSQFGAINALLSWMGAPPVSWFSSFATSFAANVTTNAWLGFPFMMVVCLGALQAIPKELEEAAEMDGAGGITRFFKVILPLIKPALVPAVILGTVWTFNMFNVIFLVSGGEPDGSTEILISEAYRWAFTRQEQYGYAAAYAVLIFLALVGYTAFTSRLRGRIHEEAA